MSSSRQRSSKQRSSRSRDRDSRDRDDRRRSGRGDHNSRRSDRDRDSRRNGESSRRRETPTRESSSRRINNEATTPIHFNSSSPPQQYRQHSNPNSPNSTATDNTSNISNQQTNNKQITDSEVQLDIPMADLMAYLQIVANNSSNLPLTRRDDVELGNNIVSSLSEKEYEYKCNAFIPSNVRIIGGVFGRYGNVWDLPTSEVRSFIVCICLLLYFVC